MIALHFPLQRNKSVLELVKVLLTTLNIYGVASMPQLGQFFLIAAENQATPPPDRALAIGITEFLCTMAEMRTTGDHITQGDS